MLETVYFRLINVFSPATTLGVAWLTPEPEFKRKYFLASKIVDPGKMSVSEI
jgi:hypothetical protein